MKYCNKIIFKYLIKISHVSDVVKTIFKKRGREFPVTCIRDESPLLYVYYNYSAKQLIKLQ